MAGQDVLVYQCAPGMTWVRDGGQVLLVDPVRDRAWRIEGLDAAIWDLLLLRYSFQRLVSTLAVLQNIPSEEAETMLLATVRRWQAAGIVSAGGEVQA